MRIDIDARATLKIEPNGKDYSAIKSNYLDLHIIWKRYATYTAYFNEAKTLGKDILARHFEELRDKEAEIFLKLNQSAK